MSNIREYLKSDKEERMRESFEEQKNQLLEEQKMFQKEANSNKIGLETEYPTIIEDTYEPTPQNKRDKVIEDLDFADVEVGGHHIETRTDPLELDSLQELKIALENVELELQNQASEQNIKLLRNGTNPFIDLSNVPKTDKDKYEIVPNFYDQMRNEHVSETFGRIETTDPRNADIAGVISSMQTNIEAKSFEDAVEKANYTYMITPYLVSLSTNSRFIDKKDTGFSDTRMQLWEKSHDIRPNTENNEQLYPGKINNYFDSIEDFFNRVQEQPFVLDVEEAALDIGIGTYWKDARIKFNRNPEENQFDAIVESRAVSTQPTIDEEVAMNGFYLGRLLYAQAKEEELLDIEKVNKNRYAAMHNGLDTKLYDCSGELAESEEILKKEIKKAEEGLQLAGIDQTYTGEDYNLFADILYERLQTGTPADKMAEEYYETLNSGKEREEALMQGLENQKI